MRTFIILGAILAIGAAVYAYGPGMMGQGYGHGMMGQGYCQGYGQGYGPGMMGQKNGRPGMGMYNQNVKQLTAEEAKKAFETFIAENYKGYVIESVNPFTMPRGTVYSASVVDASGNKFAFHLNPWGNVVGPVPNR